MQLRSPYETDQFAAFIAAIRERPDDDLPRMMCADWLEEQGEVERAEFIRVQCELARLQEPELKTIGPIGNPDHADHDGGRCGQCAKASATCRYHELSIRERALWEGNPSIVAVECLGGTTIPIRLWGVCGTQTSGPPVTGFSWRIEWRFARGFLESLRIHGADWIEHGKEIVRRNPVRKVTITVVEWMLHNTAWASRDHPGIAFTFEPEPEPRRAEMIDRTRRLLGIADEAMDAITDATAPRRRQGPPPSRTRFPRPR